MILKRSEAAENFKQLLLSAGAEASRRGDQRIGTDHLLLAVLADPSSQAAADLGVDLAAARAASDGLDHDALRAIGVRVGPIPETEPAAAPRRLLPLSSGARTVIQRAVELAGPRRTGRIGGRDFLLALLERTRPDPAAELLEALEVDIPLLRARLTPGGSRVR
jgi:ATP-dependent Clp protease ATP-binding subunit ClpA